VLAWLVERKDVYFFSHCFWRQHEAERREAVHTTLERNPVAFRPRILGPVGWLGVSTFTLLLCQPTNQIWAQLLSERTEIIEDDAGISAATGGPAAVLTFTKRGCNCDKSLCLKKYCDCFNSGLPCSELCRCKDCKVLFSSA
jgi:hypothetical protein